MSEIREKDIEINLDEKPRFIKFTLNAIDIIQDHYDMPVSEVIKKIYSTNKDDMKVSYKYLRYVLTVLLNDNIDLHNETSNEPWEPVTEGYVGRRVSQKNLGNISLAVLQAFTANLPKNNGDDDDPNPTSE